MHTQHGYPDHQHGTVVEIDGKKAKYAMRLAFTQGNKVRLLLFTEDMEHRTEILCDRGKEPYWPTYLIQELSVSKAREKPPIMGGLPITKPLHALLKRGPTTALKEQASGGS